MSAAEEASARVAGRLADQEFAEACQKAGIKIADARIGSPLLNLHIAWQRRRQAFAARAA